VKAYILAAGNGSRLRPLTHELPKPMVPLVNRPLVSHLIEHLRPHVDHIRLNVAYNKRPLIEFLDTQQAVSYFDEGGSPLGSARTLEQENQYLQSGPVLVACGDILCNWNVPQMLNFHATRRALVTVAVRRIADPRPFGVVVTDGEQRIVRFVEKPQVPPSQFISCGIYLFSPEVLRYWNPAWRDIGCDLLPELVGRELPVYAWPMDPLAFWSDIGSPETYLNTHLRLTGGLCTLDPNARIASDTHLSDTVVGANAEIGRGSRLERCVVWPGACIPSGTFLYNTIVTPLTTVAVDSAYLCA